MSMPDKWEYPWFAAWDMGFHCVALAHVDPAFAKYQLVLLCREWFQHPTGALPAYEWDFGDVNPPVQAWAALEVFAIDGARDLDFLSRVFDKLLVNFTWWVNLEDAGGNNLFEGGFLGLDNIGPLDRSHLPVGGRLEQSDATGWMAFYALTMGGIAFILNRSGRRPTLDLVLKFLEHFAAIRRGHGHAWACGTRPTASTTTSWSPRTAPRCRSRSGRWWASSRCWPPWSSTVRCIARAQAVGKRASQHVRTPRRPQAAWPSRACCGASPATSGCSLGVVGVDHLTKILAKLFDENEFLSPYGLRAVSAYHRDHPYEIDVEGVHASIDYEPAESTTDMFGGNSNWRGPIWFPLNYLLINALDRYYRFFGDELTIEYPTGSGSTTDARRDRR